MPDGSALERFEWRKSYSHVHQLSALGCAWEFVRRNPKFADAWSAVSSGWTQAHGPYGLKIIHAGSKPLPMSCIWSTAPEGDATAASVAWDVTATSHVLKAIAFSPKASFACQVLDLDHVDVEKTLILSADGAQNLLLREGSRSLQIAITGASITEPFCLFVDTAVREERPEFQVALLTRWRAIQSTGGLPERLFPHHPYARRAAAVLVALDGYLAGAPHRDIAIAMFGAERVERDWREPNEQMRDAVRRAIARGVALMEGGYRAFLH